ncbi:MAG: hypothetical protein J2P31_07550, partial [Blastocatellia bacterium]|nr:hypothetical protein [Blastocatellia bacterium]
MKRFLNSLLKLCCFVALIQMLIIGAAFSPSHQIAAQRLTRPPNREQQGQEEEADQPEKSAKTEAGATANSGERLTRAPIDPAKAAVLPAGSNSIPEGTKLIVELETRLSSKESRPGDLFTARISTPILDEDGRTILPADAVIEGSVVDAQPAKRPRRSGVLQLAFENLRLGDDAVVPIRGKLTNAEDEDRNRFDDEGNIKSPASHKGALTITGAGAGAGIAIGAVAGGAIAGAGVGAVAGLTVALLMKGRDVIIEP